MGRISIFAAGVVLLLAGCGGSSRVSKAELVEPPEVLTETLTGLSAWEISREVRPLADLYLSGEFAQARTGLEARVSAGAVDWQTFYFLGLCAAGLHDYREAKGSFRQALKFAPQEMSIRSDIYTNIAEVSEQMGEAAQAFLQYHMAANMNPSNTRAKSGLDRLSKHEAR